MRALCRISTVNDCAPPETSARGVFVSGFHSEALHRRISSDAFHGAFLVFRRATSPIARRNGPLGRPTSHRTLLRTPGRPACCGSTPHRQEGASSASELWSNRKVVATRLDWRLRMADEPTFPRRATTAEPEDMLKQAAGAVQDIAVAGRDLLQEFVEERPYTTAAIALGLGLLIGYSAHRPPAKRGWWD